MIYAIQCGDAVKFGKTKGNPYARLSELQTGNPVELKLLVAVELQEFCEKRIHDWLKSSRIRGEWFVLNESVKSIVKDLRIRAALGEGDQTDPDPVAYEAEYRRRFPEDFA